MTQPEIGIIGYTSKDINITPRATTALPGGAGYFAAIAASRIIQPVGLVTRIGTDFDTNFLMTRVLSEGVHVDPTKPTGTCVLTYHSDTDKSQRDMTVDFGANKDLTPSDVPTSWLGKLKLAHIATMPPEQQEPFIHFFRLRAPHTPLSFDTDAFLLKNKTTKQLIAEMLPHVDLVFANRIEYQELKSVIDKLPQAVIKLDKDGARYLSHGVIQAEFQTTLVEAVDATGAGDVFAGTFLASRVKGMAVGPSLEQAIATATKSVTQHGVIHLFEDTIV